jgi:competence protein ComEC
VKWFADNGRDSGKPVTERARKAARARATAIHVVEPGAADVSFLRGAWPEEVLRVRAVVPDRWKPECRDDENECSIGLRIDYCESSLLLVGDAERHEEKSLDTFGAATLLQVGHHGSETSTSDAFLTQVKPKYAVISAGKPEQGLNVTYCHPRAATIDRLNRHLGGKLDETIRAFDGKVHCKPGTSEHWHDMKASDRVWATERDGDVTLTTRGDGVFVREPKVE